MPVGKARGCLEAVAMRRSSPSGTAYEHCHVFCAVFLSSGSEDVWSRKCCEESVWFWNSLFVQRFSTEFQLSYQDKPATP